MQAHLAGNGRVPRGFPASAAKTPSISYREPPPGPLDRVINLRMALSNYLSDDETTIL